MSPASARRMALKPNGHILQTKDQLAACVERRNKHNRPAPAPLGPRKPRAPAGPARKSTRLEGRPAPIYNESALEKADGPERKKRGHLPEHHGIARFSCSLAASPPALMRCRRECLISSCSTAHTPDTSPTASFLRQYLQNLWLAVASEEEIYTEEHINLLGSCNEPW